MTDTTQLQTAEKSRAIIFFMPEKQQRTPLAMLLHPFEGGMKFSSNVVKILPIIIS